MRKREIGHPVLVTAMGGAGRAACRTMVDCDCANTPRILMQSFVSNCFSCAMPRRRERLHVDLVYMTELEEHPVQPSFEDRQCGRQDWVRAALQVCDRMQPELGCVTDEEVRSE